jgi:PBP1b-binding outer membrane lipoprotein LpoB
MNSPHNLKTKQQMKIYINGLLLLLLLSACSVSKDVETPKPALPDTFRNAAITKDTTSVADMPWKTFFTDATLQKLIDKISKHRNCYLNKLNGTMYPRLMRMLQRVRTGHPIIVWMA